eukprot:TRINITY_DN240_c0_g1_i1.p1 TRINITY_DN240_c0_g1~~TRINITY_DN240_c0_g1_i1.p1  ORF type:complete len:179 (-),score=19.64 TRINITY_DN240_c0_g1_i1:1937-2473(-)
MTQAPPLHHVEEHWNTGIFDCYQDRNSCLLGLFCPCVLFGQNVESLHGRACLGPCFLHCISLGCVAVWLVPIIGPAAYWLTPISCYACGYRTEIRSKYHLTDRPFGDCCTHFLCHPCALCQEHRQMKWGPSGRQGPMSNLDFYGGGGGDVQLVPPVPPPHMSGEPQQPLAPDSKSDSA